MLTLNQRVVGSNPTAPTRIYKAFQALANELGFETRSCFASSNGTVTTRRALEARSQPSEMPPLHYPHRDSRHSGVFALTTANAIPNFARELSLCRAAQRRLTDYLRDNLLIAFDPIHEQLIHDAIEIG